MSLHARFMLFPVVFGNTSLEIVAKSWITDCVGNQTPVVEFVNTWQTLHSWCVFGVTVFCVRGLELCGQLHAPAS
jgi:hypothetical protein